MLRVRFRHIILDLLVIYILYLVFSAIVVFYISKPASAKDMDLSFNDTNESVALIDAPSDAWQARVDLVNSAQTSLDVAYYAFQGGESVDIFVGMLLDAADRGVQVRLLMDGLANGLLKSPAIYQSLASHPNINFAYYEPLNLFKPWTLHNRLHEKIIIVDDEVAMMGGRNIGDKYITDQVPSMSIDRDVILFQGENPQASDLIQQIANHYEDLWTADITKFQNKSYSNRKMTDIRQHQAELKEKSQNQQTVADPSLSQWKTASHSIDQATFVTNPIDRIYKEPTVWSTLLNLANQAEESVFIQSPYVIPTQPMQEDIKNQINNNKQVDYKLLTNSLASSNNLLANSGYQIHRQDILDYGIQIYEFLPSVEQLHTKAMVIDQEIAVIGTFNVDSRSAYLNTESMLIIDSLGLANAVTTNLRDTHGDEISQVDPNHPEDQSEYATWKKVLSLILRPFARLFARFL